MLFHKKMICLNLSATFLCTFLEFIRIVALPSSVSPPCDYHKMRIKRDGWKHLTKHNVFQMMQCYYMHAYWVVQNIALACLFLHASILYDDDYFVIHSARFLNRLL